MTDVDDHDYEADRLGSAKEEPDCTTCSDIGCPDCGHIDPADPEHQRYVAREIAIGRHSGQTSMPLDQLLPHATAEQRAEIQRLADTAIVTTSVRWPTHEELSKFSDERPF